MARAALIHARPGWSRGVLSRIGRGFHDVAFPSQAVAGPGSSLVPPRPDIHPAEATAIAAPPSSPWRLVQDALSGMGGQTLGRFCGPRGQAAAPLSQDPAVCALMRSHPEAGARCREQCDQGVARSIASGRAQLFQCHAKLAVFISPYGGGNADTPAEALLGGKVFTDYQALQGFRAYAADLGFGRKDLDPLIPDLRMVPLDGVRQFMDQARQVTETFLADHRRRHTAQAQNERIGYLFEIFGALETEPVDELPLAVLHGLGILFNCPAGLLLANTDIDGLTVRETFSGNSPLFAEDELRRVTINTTLPWVQEALLGRPEQPHDAIYDLLKAGFPPETTSVELFTIASTPRPLVIALLNTRLTPIDRRAIGMFCRHAGLLMEREAIHGELEREFPDTGPAPQRWDTADLDQLAAVILEQAVAASGAAQASVMLVEAAEQQLRVRAIDGLHLKYVEYVRIAHGEGIAGSVWARGKPLLVRDITQEPELTPFRRSRYRTHSFICMPIVLGDRVLGVINLADRRDGAAFDARDLRRLAPIAQKAALAIDRVEARRATEVLRRASMTDYLTGLLNRGAFDQRLHEEVERAQRYPYANPLSLLVVDIDDFKRVNDTYGLLTGDDCIRACAQTLKEGTRNIDSVYRRGGEEFTVLLPHTSREAALTLAERLCRAMAAMKVVTKNTPTPIAMTISIGLATLPDDGHTDETLFKRANQALHRAKQSGKNRVVTLPPEPLTP